MKRLSKWKTGLIMIGIILMMVPLSWTGARTETSDKTNSDNWQGKIYGVISSSETGKVLPGANIIIMGTQKGAAADNNGQYFIPQLPPGIYNLQAVMIGYGNVLIKDVVVKSGESTKLNFILSPQVIPFSRVVEQVKKSEKQKTPKPKSPSPPPSPEDSEYVFIAYDEPPVPVGGYNAIQEKLIYPEIARKAGAEGRVEVQTQIDVNGEVISTKVVQSLGSNGCDEAAVAAIRAVKWKPAMNRDQPVKVWILIPIDFKLGQESKNVNPE